ncbi:hypothetical protein E2F50_20150 [Rhizobium deserti]|uniref:Uncharacterized protein n=1 Tax=Rhizobium deserti TaxID=2547961 RepID=A0A4V3ANN0_9HYPH|nr:hypothetical protein [Rhizobium deserti]TDK31258.1 hypothetical protein E2F50_20150 [Rhizobium deserti]
MAALADSRHGREAPTAVIGNTSPLSLWSTLNGDRQMDVLDERLVGKELREIQHNAGHETIIAFEDGAITVWTEVRINIVFGDDPVRVKELVTSDEWYEILLDAGTIRISRIPIWPCPECFIYGSKDDRTVMIVDRGEE